MADGKICKTCGCQEAEHTILNNALFFGNGPDDSVPSAARNWPKEKLLEFFIKNGMPEKEIEEFYYDVARCPGFSTTRKPRKNWESFAE